MTAQESIKYKVLSIKGESKKSFLGFTLIELMVAIAIIAILGAVGLVMYGTAQKSGRISKRVQDLNALKTTLELYKSATGFYPSTTIANQYYCIGAAGSGLSAALTPNYMPVLPADPLDGSSTTGTYCYEYAANATTNATHYKLRTKPAVYGANGEMNSTAFLSQPSLIDPDRDGTVDDDCSIQTTGTIQGWAIHSGDATMCDL